MFATTFLGYTFGVFFVMLGIVVWIALALLPATIAKNKGHSFWLWFIVSIFFWWITLFVTLFMHDQTHHTGSYPA
jgi:ABC-type Mn2+/Zn2+ transport system permease subunit